MQQKNIQKFEGKKKIKQNEMEVQKSTLSQDERIMEQCKGKTC